VKSAFVQPDSPAPSTLCVSQAGAEACTRLPTLTPEDSSDATNPPELNRNKIQVNQSIELRRLKLRLIDDRFISLLPLFSKNCFMMAGLCDKRGGVGIARRGYFAYPLVGI
jgi:hypothetical protein